MTLTERLILGFGSLLYEREWMALNSQHRSERTVNHTGKQTVPGTAHTVSRLSDIGGGVLNREGSKPLNYREKFSEFYFRDKYTK